MSHTFIVMDKCPICGKDLANRILIMDGDGRPFCCLEYDLYEKAIEKCEKMGITFDELLTAFIRTIIEGYVTVYEGKLYVKLKR